MYIMAVFLILNEKMFEIQQQYCLVKIAGEGGLSSGSCGSSGSFPRPGSFFFSTPYT
mgnify:CR=1 FL=1